MMYCINQYGEAFAVDATELNSMLLDNVTICANKHAMYKLLGREFTSAARSGNADLHIISKDHPHPELEVSAEHEYYMYRDVFTTD